MRVNKFFSQTQEINKLMRSRLFYIFGGVVVLFSILIYKFYQLQIVEHTDHAKEVIRGTQRSQDTQATRGQIFDRYGMPLAVNKPLYVLHMNQQIKLSKAELNEVLLNVCNLLESNGDTYKDDVPISMTPPFRFIEDDGEVKKFISSIPYNGIEHRNELVELTAEELVAYLRSNEVFQINEEYTSEEARKIIALRHQMYQLAYQKYKPVTLASDISEETIASIEEYSSRYPGVMVEVESYRHYPYAEVFGNILGYTRQITQSQYEEYQKLGYNIHDVVGQMGIEATMEEQLRGVKGEELIQVDNVGRPVEILESNEAKLGNDVFLTLDGSLQLRVYEAIEKRLSEALIYRLKGGGKGVEPLEGREVLISMVESNQLKIKDMSRANEGTMQHQLYQRLNKLFETKGEEIAKEQGIDSLTMKALLLHIIKQDSQTITDRELMLALVEQGALKLESKLVERIWKGTQPGTATILIHALETGAVVPSQMAVTPFSAAAVVVDIDSGEVLSMVGYPSYDSNQLTTNFNAYYSLLQDGIDKRNLLWNRALMTAKAPGSTYKMISALIGLEERIVNEHTVISDVGPYSKAGTPEPRCWFFTNNGYGHGASNIHRALEVSCNYYFYELAYRLGEKYGSPYDAIKVFTEYASKFGLDRKTGIELPEANPHVSNPENLVQGEITKALNVIKNLSDKGQEVLDALLIEQLELGIYPTIKSGSQIFEERLSYSMQVEIKADIDKAFERGYKSEFKEINQSFIQDIKEPLQEGISSYAQELTEEVFAHPEGQLKTKTKKEVTEFLISHISRDTEKLIMEVVEKVGSRFLKGIYKDSLENILEAAHIHKYTREEQVHIRAIIDNLETNPILAQEWLVKEIRIKVVETLVEYLFESSVMEWNNGINVRTAIGQGNNAFTPTQIARYVAALAHGETVYDLKLVGGTAKHKEGIGYESLPDKVLKTMDFNSNSLEIVYEGMYEVVHGNEGTARREFADSNTTVAGKTGTAQELGTEHSWFAGFAPYDDPEIAVVTTIYDAKGLGKYNYLLANDVFNAVFEESTVIENDTTLDTVFVE